MAYRATQIGKGGGGGSIVPSLAPRWTQAAMVGPQAHGAFSGVMGSSSARSRMGPAKDADPCAANIWARF